MRMIATRALAVLSAACLVAAFTLATVLPPFTSCAEALADMDHASLVALKTWSETNLPAWLWERAVIPVLLRPVWLPPTALGLVFLGCAITLGSHKRVTRSHRRRS